jgi:hypothetical protein
VLLVPKSKMRDQLSRALRLTQVRMVKSAVPERIAAGSAAKDPTTPLQKRAPPAKDAWPLRVALFPLPDESAAWVPPVSANL